MVQEADNPVLVHLREIRSVLADHTVRFDKLEGRFSNLEKGFNDMRFM